MVSGLSQLLEMTVDCFGERISALNDEISQLDQLEEEVVLDSKLWLTRRRLFSCYNPPMYFDTPKLTRWLQPF